MQAGAAKLHPLDESGNHGARLIPLRSPNRPIHCREADLPRRTPFGDDAGVQVALSKTARSCPAFWIDAMRAAVIL